VEAAEAAGHEAHVIDHLKCNIEIEQTGPALYYQNQYLKGFDAVIPRIGASVTFYGTAVVRQFEMMNVFTAVGSRGIIHSRDKLRCLQVLSKDRNILGLEIHIGRNRIVRRIFAHLGYEVEALDRVMYAGLDKKDLKRGHYRFLTEQEVIRLKYYI
jgi:glutathione synthase/RimK-type ligase-like ATP-grasp enzyme